MSVCNGAAWSSRCRRCGCCHDCIQCRHGSVAEDVTGCVTWVAGIWVGCLQRAASLTRASHRDQTTYKQRTQPPPSHLCEAAPRGRHLSQPTSFTFRGRHLSECPDIHPTSLVQPPVSKPSSPFRDEKGGNGNEPPVGQKQDTLDPEPPAHHSRLVSSRSMSRHLTSLSIS